MPISISGDGPITGITSLNTTVSSTELGYLDGTTSAIQTQINTKSNDSAQGLYLISSQTVTAQSNLTMDGIFTLNYQNYLLIYNVTSITNAGIDITIQYRWSNATTTSASYSFADEYLRLDASQNGFNGGSNLTSHYLGRSLQSTEPLLNGTLEILNPRTSGTLARTMIGQFVSCQNGGPRYLYRNASMLYDGSKDGLYIATTGGTMTGTFKVYGRKD